MVYFTGDKKHVAGRIKRIKKVLNKIAMDHQCDIKELVYVLVDDEKLLEINKQVLKHDYYTDIITFDYSDGKKLEGEIYISIDRVKENALSFGAEFHVELLRVICHGVLHMVGYRDKSKPEKEMMRQKEDYYINLNE
jgi:probable rRNA maturation factor